MADAVLSMGYTCKYTRNMDQQVWMYYHMVSLQERWNTKMLRMQFQFQIWLPLLEVLESSEPKKKSSALIKELLALKNLAVSRFIDPGHSYATEQWAQQRS